MAPFQVYSPEGYATIYLLKSEFLSGQKTFKVNNNSCKIRWKTANIHTLFPWILLKRFQHIYIVGSYILIAFFLSPKNHLFLAPLVKKITLTTITYFYFLSSDQFIV